jgi:hypothetical protein
MMCYIRRGAEGRDGVEAAAAVGWGGGKVRDRVDIGDARVCVCVCVYSYGGGRFVVSGALLPPPRGQLNFSDITSASAVIPSACATPNASAAAARG